MKKGTPKSLTEAIRNAMLSEDGFNDAHDLIELTRLHVKDYLAQKFSILTLEAHKGSLNEKNILDFFHKITK